MADAKRDAENLSKRGGVGDKRILRALYKEKRQVPAPIPPIPAAFADMQEAVRYAASAYAASQTSPIILLPVPVYAN